MHRKQERPRWADTFQGESVPVPRLGSQEYSTIRIGCVAANPSSAADRLFSCSARTVCCYKGGFE